MLVASRNEMIRDKVSQIVGKASSGRDRRRNGFFMEQGCSIEAAQRPVPMQPHPHPTPHPRPFRMISYDDMMLAD